MQERRVASEQSYRFKNCAHVANNQTNLQIVVQELHERGFIFLASMRLSEQRRGLHLFVRNEKNG
jgi:hypothetical protein